MEDSTWRGNVAHSPSSNPTTVPLRDDERGTLRLDLTTPIGAAGLEHEPEHHHLGHPHKPKHGEVVGSGLVSGAADDDPSGIGTYANAGAQLGSNIIWTSFLTLPLMIVVQEAAARLAILRREGLLTTIRTLLPRPVLWFVVTALLLINATNIIADMSAMGATIQLLLPGPLWVWTTLIAAIILWLEIWVPYRTYSRILRWLTISLISYLVVAIMVTADWGVVGRELLSPRMEWSSRWFAMFFAILGTTISPYMMIWESHDEAHEVLHPVDMVHPVRNQKRHLRMMRWDTILGMIAANVVMFSVYLTAIQALPLGTEITTANQAASLLAPLGPLVLPAFALGIIGTGMLAIPILASTTALGIQEVFHDRDEARPTARHKRKRFLRFRIIILVMIAGSALGSTLLSTPPWTLLVIAAWANAILAPLIGVLLIIAMRKGGVQQPWWSIVGLWATVLVFILSGLAIILLR